jgi:hypothetical protein
MIIWLASYPKSGNTWLRFLIMSLILKDEDEINLGQLSGIKQFPSSHQYNKLNVNDINYSNLNDISNYWIETQKIINSDKSIKFFKTHNALCKINNNIFTDLDNTLGVIYIVRDPRNVVSSINNHYHHIDLEFSKNFIFDEKKGIMKKSKLDVKSDYALPQIIGSWKTHYNSWKNMKKNYLLIKYENLIINPKKEFKKVTNYLEKLMGLNFSEELIDKAIKLSSFDRLQNLEKKKGFSESVIDPNSGVRKKFFNLGPKNNWRENLDKKISNEIEKEFENEMIELGYL